MAPLTWRNVDAPNFSGVTQSLAAANQMMNEGLEGVSGALDRFEETRRRNRLTQDMKTISSFGSAADIAKARSEGRLNLGSAEGYAAAMKQESNLLANDATRANTAGQNIANATNTYGLDRTKLLDQRTDEKFNANLASQPLLTQAYSLALDGNVEGANKIIMDNREKFAQAGIVGVDSLRDNLTAEKEGQGAQTGRLAHAENMRTAKLGLDTRNWAKEIFAMRDEAGKPRFLSADEAKQYILTAGREQGRDPELIKGTLAAMDNGAWDPNALNGYNLAAIAKIDTTAPPQGQNGASDAIRTAANPFSGSRVASEFMGALAGGAPDRGVAGLTNPFAQAAVAATVKNESNWSEGNIGKSWSDPSVSGKAGTSGELMSWRDGRLSAVRAHTAKYGNTPAEQAIFFLGENPKLTAALQNARSVEEAQQLINTAWGFAGYKEAPNDKNETGERLRNAQEYYAQITGNPIQGTPAVAGAGGGGGGASTPSGLLASAAGSPSAASMGYVTANDGAAQDLLASAAPRVLGTSATTGAAPASDAPPVSDLLSSSSGSAPAAKTGDLPASPSDANTDVAATPNPAANNAEAALRTAAQAPINIDNPNYDGPMNIRAIEEGQSQFRNGAQTRGRQDDVDNAVDMIRTQVSRGFGDEFAGNRVTQMLGSAYDYFTADAQTQQKNTAGRERAGAASEWWNSEQARQYFRDRPQELAKAAEDPLAFAERVVGTNKAAEAPASTALAAAAQTAPTPAPAQTTSMAINETRTQARRDEELTIRQSLEEMSKQREPKPKEMIRLARKQFAADGNTDQYASLTASLEAASSDTKDPTAVTKSLKESGLAGVDQSVIDAAVTEVTARTGARPAAVEALIRNNIKGNPNQILSNLANMTINDAVEQVIDLDKLTNDWQQYQNGNGSVAGGARRMEIEERRASVKARMDVLEEASTRATAEYERIRTMRTATAAEKAEAKRVHDLLQRAFAAEVYGLLAEGEDSIYSRNDASNMLSQAAK